MLAIPALDVRDGVCVQLAGAEGSQATAASSDPVEVARTWSRFGFRRLHVVDLDAATGRGTNADVVRDVLADAPARVQVAGGVASGSTIEQLLEEGAEWVVMGPRALAESEWLEGTASTFPNRLIVAVEIRDRRIVTRAPAHAPAPARNVIDFVEELGHVPVAAVLVTVLHREELDGRDLFLMEDLADSTEHPVIVAGGAAAPRGLRALQDRGIAAVVLGRPLYSGELDPRMVAEEFAE